MPLKMRLKPEGKLFVADGWLNYKNEELFVLMPCLYRKRSEARMRFQDVRKVKIVLVAARARKG